MAEKSRGDDFEYYEYVLNFVGGITYDYLRYIVISIESLFDAMIKNEQINTERAVIFSYRIGTL